MVNSIGKIKTHQIGPFDFINKSKFLFMVVKKITGIEKYRPVICHTIQNLCINNQFTVHPGLLDQMINILGGIVISV